MRDNKYLLSLLDYNQWANEKFFDRLLELPAAEVSKIRESQMKSMLISMNHLLVIDKVWLAHMRGEKHGFTSLQTMLHEDIGDLRAAKAAMDSEIRDYVAGLDDAALEEVIDYDLMSGNKGRLPRYMIITHLSVHGGYHRGFIGDMFGQVPAPSIGQDIPVWAREMDLTF